ncbi:MAG: VWA domain-containing protein [Rhodospirillaceae bacterium]|nr:VWA domain-containing protein [Rhodospirillaceae bacterium]
MMVRRACLVLLVVAGFMTARTASADNNMLLILDASNSMWGQTEGVAKIETAKDVLSGLLNELSPETSIALMLYGHRREGDCADIELVSPFGSGSRDNIRDAILGITPRGKTPIAASLQAAADAFAGLEEDPANSIVLISDGIESCDGDPCGVAEALIEHGINLSIHVVGFDVDDEARAQLQCIAERGNGEYFDAANPEGFRAAVESAQEAAVAVPEPEPEPTFTEYFRDDFDGPDLSDFWEIGSPNPDNFIVENGALLAITSSTGSLVAENVENLFSLAGTELPEGDWIASARVNVALQTGVETFYFGVHDGPDSMIMAELRSTGDGYYGWKLLLRLEKIGGGEATTFDAPLASLGCNSCTADQMFRNFAATVPQPIELRLVKEGRSFYAMAKLAGDDSPWVSTDKLTTLRVAGSLAFGTTQYGDTGGETYVEVDEIKIEVPN